MAKQILDIVSAREIPGSDKKAWSKHGIVLIGEDGRMSIKLESLPVGNEFNGWLSVFEQKPREDRQPAQQQEGRQPAPQDQGNVPF